MARTTKAETNKARSYSVSLPPELFSAATKAAFGEHLSFSALVRRLIAKELKRREA
jgi:hypothetical protein